MKINNSLFNPNRLVFQNETPEAPQQASDGSKTDTFSQAVLDLGDYIGQKEFNGEKVDPKIQAAYDKAWEAFGKDEADQVAAAKELAAALNPTTTDESAIRQEIAEVRTEKAEKTESGRKSAARAHHSDVAKPKPQISSVEPTKLDPYDDPWAGKEGGA